MNDDAAIDGNWTPAHQRLATLVALTLVDAPRADETFTDAVMRTARWQHVLRALLAQLADLAAVLVEGVALLLGVRVPTPDVHAR